MEDIVKMVVELAREIDVTDPVDFGMLCADEDHVRTMLATGIVKEAFAIEDRVSRELMLLSSLTHLVTENFVLNQRLLSLIQSSKS